jgi:hypothetical protein
MLDTKNTYEIDTIKKNILKLSPTDFAYVVESSVKKYYETKGSVIEPPEDKSYDAIIDKLKEEIKGTRSTYSVEKKIKDGGNIYETIKNFQKGDYVKDEELLTANWLCNIQQIKYSCFVFMSYMVFAEDSVYLFRISSDQLSNEKNLGLTNQHRDGVETQFKLKKNCFQYHLDNYLVEKMSWENFCQLIDY